MPPKRTTTRYANLPIYCYRTWPTEHAFAFTATRSTPEQNRRQLGWDLAAWIGEPMDPGDYPSWRAVFDLLSRIRPDEAQVVVIDEVQYLADSALGLAEVASEINATFERVAARRPFVLALSGSAVSTLTGLAAGGAPLYGRLALHPKLEPLGPLEVAAFVRPDLERTRARCGLRGSWWHTRVLVGGGSGPRAQGEPC